LDCALHQQRAHILARRILETEAHLAPIHLTAAGEAALETALG
jgi:hypothetical protein